MNNKIIFFTNLEKRLSVHIKIDNVSVPLEFNPYALLKLKNEGNLDLFIGVADEQLGGVHVSHGEDIVSWVFPENKQYANLSGKTLQFDKKYYLDGLQSVLLEIINKTNFLNGVNRKTIIVPGGSNLRDFLLKNKEVIVSALV